MVMKSLLLSIARRLTRILMRSDFLWESVRRLPSHDYFFRQRYSVIHKRARRQCAHLLDRREVLAGPFAGMKYAEEAAVGSSLWPKLLGTYESELRDHFESIIRQQRYRKIVDVGYAEGFYLVGFGRLFGQAELVGFDSDAEAQRLCQANAETNGIGQQRLKLFGAFDAETFQQSVDDDALVVVDCEGFENDVVQSLSTNQLCCADWLIETHDHLVEGTTERISNRLSETHEIATVDTDDDLNSKCRLLPISIRRTCDDYVQEALVSEGRQATQTWIIAKRRAA